MEMWEIIDTIVKVALGAGLCAVGQWLSQASWQRDKSVIPNRRLELLEDVAQHVGNVNHVFTKYWALIVESTRYGDQWPKARLQELDQVTGELVSVFKEMADAESKLLLLGEKRLEKALKLYSAKIGYVRKYVYVGRQDLPDQEIAELKKEIAGLRDQFYDILSKRYDRALQG